MTGSVVRIGQALPIPELVDHAKSLLAAVESGEIRSFAYVAELRDGATRTYLSPTLDVVKQIGQLTYLAHRTMLKLEQP